MKIISIKITDYDCTIKWSTENATTWSLTTDRKFSPEFGDAISALGKVAAVRLSHDAELLSVRSVVISENSKGIAYVKLAGVLAGVSTDATAKPGKFSTPKIEVDLFAKDEVRAMEKAAKQYAKEAEGAA